MTIKNYQKKQSYHQIFRLFTKKMTLSVIVFTFTLLLNGCMLFQNDGISNFTIDISSYEIETFTYKEFQGNDVELDIIKPLNSNADQYPVVIYIHGGGYTGGNKEMGYSGFFGYVNKLFLENGYAVVSINYTLVNSANGTTMYNSFIDAKDAVRWLYKNANNLSIDTSNIGVFGSSAGGGIATMIGYSEDNDFSGSSELREYSSQLSFVVNLFGADTRLLSDELQDYTSIEEISSATYKDLNQNGYRFGLYAPFDFDLLITTMQELNSLSYLDALDPPTISLHGTADTTVEIRASVILADQLNSLNIINEFYQIKGMGHSFDSKALNDEERIIYANYILSFVLYLNI